MARTFLRQDTQVRQSDVFDDTVAAGSTLESGAANIEDDLNGLRSQLARLQGDTDWFAALSGRSVAAIHTDLADVEGKKVLCRSQLLTDVTVPAAQNWKILSVAGSEAPTQVAAVALTQNGAVVAQSALSGAGFDVHELIEIAGASAVAPKNLALVRDSTTGQAVQSSGRDVFALLQYESTGVDGAAFNDTSGGNRVKLSFIRLTAGLDDLEACPVADIANLVINYSYIFRIDFDSIPEDCFIANGTFTDLSAATDVTLDRAIDNQAGPATQGQDIDIDQSLGIEWFWRDATSADVFGVIEGSGTSDTEVRVTAAVDLFNVDAVDNDFANGIKVDTGAAGTTINVGVTANQIDSGGALTVASGGAADLSLSAALELLLADGNKAASTFAGALKLSETTAEWDAYEVAFGEVSLLNAIEQAATAAARTKTTGLVINGPHAANTNISGVGGTPQLDAQLGDYSTVASFVTDVDVFLNGVLMRGGANAAADHDVYPGNVPANGDLKFEFIIKNNDVVTMIVNGG